MQYWYVEEEGAYAGGFIDKWMAFRRAIDIGTRTITADNAHSLDIRVLTRYNNDMMTWDESWKWVGGRTFRDAQRDNLLVVGG